MAGVERCQEGRISLQIRKKNRWATNDGGFLRSKKRRGSSVEWIALEELNVVREGNPGNSINRDDR